VLDHPRDVVDESVTGGLGSDVRSSEGESLTGEDTREGVGVLKRGRGRRWVVSLAIVKKVMQGEAKGDEPSCRLRTEG